MGYGDPKERAQVPGPRADVTVDDLLLVQVVEPHRNVSPPGPRGTVGGS